MAFDPNDPEQVAAVNAAKVAVTTALETAHASKVAELTGKITAAETLAASTAADLQAAKDSGTATATELAALKAKAEAAEAKAATLEAAETARQTAADAAIVAALPEALRPLVAGKSGAELKAHAELLNVHANKPVPGRSQGDGAAGVVTEDMRAFAVQHMGPLMRTADDETITSVYKSLEKLRPKVDASA